MVIIEGQPVFVLHVRKYTDSKKIVDFLTLDHGRVSAVYRERTRKTGTSALNLFAPLIINWNGKSSLKNIRLLESNGAVFHLTGKALFSGLYLNELIQRVLPQDDPNEDIYHEYVLALEQLAGLGDCSEMAALEKILRRFELRLLDSLGYGFNFEYDALQQPIDPTLPNRYTFVDGEGFCPYFMTDQRPDVFLAQNLGDVKSLNFECASSLRAAKVLCRLAIGLLLGDKPLKSKELFR